MRSRKWALFFLKQMTFSNWQKTNRIVAEIDEPLVTKDSRETFHNTSKTFASLNAAFTSMSKPKEKLKEYFHDTITEFENELTANEIADAFVEVLTENYTQAFDQYKQAKELLEYFQK